LDREEAVSRLERELASERSRSSARTRDLQFRLEDALKQGQVAAKDGENIRMAFAAAQMAHEREVNESARREKKLNAEISSLQVSHIWCLLIAALLTVCRGKCGQIVKL
jgi:hypothetical protein